VYFHLIFLDLMIFGEEYKLWNSLFSIFLYPWINSPQLLYSRTSALSLTLLWCKLHWDEVIRNFETTLQVKHADIVKPFSQPGYLVGSWWRTPLRHPPKITLDQ
jgi:hypothetical protein